MVLGSALGPGLSGWLMDAGVPFEQQLLYYAATFLVVSALMIPAVAQARRAV